MPYKHVWFRHLDDLLAFLEACEFQEVKLGEKGRRAYENVAIDVAGSVPGYAVGFQTEDWDGSGFLYGGDIRAGTFDGMVEIHLNQLFRRFPVRPWASAPTPIPALVLRCEVKGAGQAAVAEAQALLHKAWRTVPRNDEATSRFFVCGNRDGTPHSLVVHISHVHASFDYEQFRQAIPTQDLAMYVPAWHDDHCFLFVLWGYEYLRAKQFYSLYDENRDDAGELMLCEPGKAIPGAKASKASAKSVWCEAKWHVIEGESYSRSGDLLDDIEPFVVHDDDTTRLRAGPVSQAGLSLRLEMVPLGSATASGEDMERGISVLENQLQELRSRHGRFQMLMEQTYRPVYTFLQPLSAGTRSADLPPHLATFLNRPLGELSQYWYAQGQRDGSLIHYLVGQNPVARGAAHAVRCDQLYLQDARWMEWNLPLFLRADSSFSIAVDEFDVAAKVWQLIGEQVPGGTECVLVEPPAQDDSDQGASMCLRVLPLCEPLDELLCYVNELGQGQAAAALVSAERLHGATVTFHRVKVSQEIQNLYRQLREHCDTLLATAESEWETIRENVRTALTTMRLADVCMTITADQYAQLPATWKDFVTKTLATDAELARLKLEAVEAWQTSIDERATATQQLANSQFDTEVEINQAATDLANVLGNIAKTQAKLETPLADLAKVAEDVKQAHDQLDRRKAAISAEIAGLQAQAKALNDKTDSIEKATTELDRATEALQKSNLKLLTATDLNHSTFLQATAELKALEQALVQRSGQTDEKRHQIAEQSATLKIGLEQAREQLVRLQKESATFAGQGKVWQKEKQHLEQTMERLTQKKSEMENLRSQVEDGRVKNEVVCQEIRQIHDYISDIVAVDLASRDRGHGWLSLLRRWFGRKR